MPNRKFPIPVITLALLFYLNPVGSQMITGHWKGRINRQKVEIKIIQQGDRLTGTSYYYESANHFRKYSIRGYFDPQTNSAVWWDDVLLEERTGRVNITTPGKVPLLSRADFNCPGEGRMILEGKAARKETDSRITGDLRLDKTSNPEFHDEWDEIIDNYLVGANDPDWIEEVEKSIRPVGNREEVQVKSPETVKPVTEKQVPVTIPGKPLVKKDAAVVPPPALAQSIIEKFSTREKKLVKEIPLEGDSIEIRFYDNAEIDGDSITIFLNGRIFREHIRLTGNAYTVKLAIGDLEDSNELIMVAENLGSIPPNTSYMVALVNEKKYEAYLSSTEGSSALIRLIKPQR